MNKFAKQCAFGVGVVVVALTAACKKPPIALQPKPEVNADSVARARQDSLERARRDSIRQAELARQAAEADSLRAAREQEQREAAQNANAMAVLTATVYFDYDQSALSDAAKEVLAAKLPILQARSQLHLLVTGHTDNRGASEYNMALGMRRAASVKEWLVANGIPAERIEIMSMGEERPAVPGEGEEVWSKNRRCEFEPFTGNEGEGNP
jgi:peptidoglycan-associated lipoprotein